MARIKDFHDFILRIPCPSQILWILLMFLPHDCSCWWHHDISKLNIWKLLHSTGHYNGQVLMLKGFKSMVSLIYHILKTPVSNHKECDIPYSCFPVIYTQQLCPVGFVLHKDIYQYKMVLVVCYYFKMPVWNYSEIRLMLSIYIAIFVSSILLWAFVKFQWLPG